MVTIRVFYSSTGNPSENSKVSIAFDGLFGGVTSNEYTDENGDAHFDVNPDNGTVYVDGKTVHKGYLSGRVIVYI